MVMSFALVFLECEIGHELCSSFIEIDYAVEQMDWYKFPANLWRLLPMLMAAAQKPVNLRVFGSTSCAREDFKGVRAEARTSVKSFRVPTIYTY